MKCPTCGANLQIEDEKCPFCQNPNPFAQKHRQDMRRYHQEFQKTKREVEQKTNRFTSVTVKITVIIILAVLIAVMVYMKRDGYYMIQMNRTRKDIQMNKESYAAQLTAYEEEGNWLELYAFYNIKELYLDSDSFRPYMAVYSASYNYKGIVDYITRYYSDSNYYSPKEVTRWFAEYLDGFYDYAQRTSYAGEYYDACYTPEHQEALMRMWEDLDALLITYCHLTEEELSLLPDYSTAKKGSLIEEGLLRESADKTGEEDMDK
ncbi:MAG: zinc ribbon domain-containing protein [Bacillus sp. (in: Bacteria)]|nr:zinc ribbon domain-containing protein [Bacillus sp. (in: firmicutes)]